MPSRHDLPGLPLHAVYLYSVPGSSTATDCFMYACAQPIFVVVRGTDHGDVLTMSEDEFSDWQMDTFKLGGPIDRSAADIATSVAAINELITHDENLARRLAPVTPSFPPVPEET